MHIIGMVCRTSGVFLTQNHAILSDRMTNMQLPYNWTNMSFETLLENVTGKKLNLWINVWQDSYRHRVIGRLDRHHRRSRACDLHPRSRAWIQAPPQW